jgi:O-antigen ligase
MLVERDSVITKNRVLGRLEFFLLLGFLIVLPWLEAPKNLLLYSFLIAWAWRSYVTKSWGHRISWFEWPLLVILFLSLLSNLLTPFDFLLTLSNSIDFYSIALLGLCLYRTAFSREQQKAVFIAVLSGIGIAIFDGFLRGKPFPSLNSVGHVNHVAIYLGTFAVAIVGALTAVRSVIARLGLSVALLVTLYLAVETHSRNVIYAIGLTAVILAVVLVWIGRLRSAVAVVLCLLIAAVSVVSTTPDFWAKQLTHSQGQIRVVDEGRYRIWRGAILIAQEKPLFGWGAGNFSLSHTPLRVEKLLDQRGERYDPRRFLFVSHAHNLTLNWLVERGLLAIIIFYSWALLLTYSLIKTVKSTMRRVDTLPFVAPTFAAFGALTFSVIAGLGNTTWHHEHGLLTMVIASVFTPWGFVKSNFPLPVQG